MIRIVLFLLMMTAVCCHATLTLVGVEPFAGPGTMTGATTGTFFSAVTGTFTLVRVGPRTSSVAAPGWSADIRTSGSVNYRATVDLSGQAATCGMWGVWVRIKSLPPAGGYLSVLQLLDRASTNVIADFVINPSGVLTTTPYNYAGSMPTLTGPTISLNSWVWIGVAWNYEGNFLYGIRCLSMLPGGSLSTWGCEDNLNALDTSFSSVNVGLQTGGSGPMMRIGCPSLCSMSSFSDIAYPCAILQPVEGSYNWYVNTVTGDDANDGSTPATAWKSAAKIGLESQYSGMLDSNAAGPGNGDVLTIDTSGAPLVIGNSTLALATQGLKVQPAAGQTYINCQAEEFLANSGFTATAGLSKTYQTCDTQTNIVAWENDEWMYHVKSASYGAAAAITDPHSGTTTPFASTGAALDATPGSFYTDGSTLYIHPFNDTNPATDGNVYTRSINRNLLAAVDFSAGNYRAIGFYIRKTTLVDSGDNSFGAYCFQDGVLTGTGFSSSVEGGYFGYGDKHCFGSTSGVTASSLLVLNTDCEQGNPYCAFGGQTPFVSYSGATTADNVHTYRGCTCLARSGLVGSTSGDAFGTGGDIIYSHNNGTGISFASITLDDCNFASGSVNLSVATNLLITDQSQVGEVVTSCPNTTIQQTTFPYELVNMQSGAATLSVQNCLIKPTYALSPAPPYYGFYLLGSVLIEGCTFDLSGITGNSAFYFQQAIIQRTGALNLTFRNNAYVVPPGKTFPLLYGITSSDTLTFDHNAYDLGCDTTLVRNFNGTTALTFAQWQALGEDCNNSSLNANLLLEFDVPQPDSPLFNAGVDLGPTTDVTGTAYTDRNTIGAYEGSATYLPAQSIDGFPSLQSLTFSGTAYALPATTSAGLTINYTVTGPATISGNDLTLTGTGTVTVVATQSGNDSYAPLSETSTITSTPPPPATETPTMPAWALTLLGTGLLAVAPRRCRSALSPK